MTKEELKKGLKSQEWRLNNLYWIKDKKGNRIKFRLNWAQKLLYKNLWFLNVILKVRQLGVTTFICLLYLDECIFYGKDAGLIAHTFDDAKKIFETKVRYAWDNLPEVLRNEYNLDSESVRQLKFTRGKTVSSIYVGTSLRSGTVQNLHISEFGTIDQKYPAKSEEIKTGAFNTVEKGQRITVESTAKGQVGNFADICQQGIELEKRKLSLTEMDWKFFFLPWYLHPQYQLKANIIIPVEFKEYFTKLENELDIKLSQEQRNWYFKKSSLQKDSMKSEYPSTPAEAFLATIEGAYYSKQMMRVMEEKRIRNVPYEPSILVDTWWDIGTAKKKSDATSIVFTQDIGLEIHIIDFYGNSGEGLKHYVKVLQDKPYVYKNHWAPHNIKIQEFGTGKTRLEMAAKFGIRFRVVPNIGLLDGIEAVRIILSKCWFDEEKTARLRKALLSYRKEWDDKLGKWIEHPLGDWSADPADAFRMIGVGHQDHIKLGKYDKQEEEMERIREQEKGGFDPFSLFPDMG